MALRGGGGLLRPGCTLKAAEVSRGPPARALLHASSSRAAKKVQTATMATRRPFIACHGQCAVFNQAGAPPPAPGWAAAIQLAQSVGGVIECFERIARNNHRCTNRAAGVKTAPSTLCLPGFRACSPLQG